MEIEDLEFGMILETRNNIKYVYHAWDGFCYSLNGQHTLDTKILNKDFTSKFGDWNDIIRIYKDYTCQKVLWERQEITEDEKTLLRCLPKNIKYLARDEEGELWCFETKPFKEEDYWNCKPYDAKCYELNVFKHLFQFVKWEDEEPTSIEELLEAGD